MTNEEIDECVAVLAKLADLCRAAKLDKLPRDYPIIIAMCDAAYGKAQSHKWMTKQKPMWRALIAALDHLGS